MAVMTLWLAYYRYYRLKYSSAALRRSKKHMKVNQSGYDVKSLKLVLSHFPGRLIGTVSLGTVQVGGDLGGRCD
jgi:hypothetical protein